MSQSSLTVGGDETHNPSQSGEMDMNTPSLTMGEDEPSIPQSEGRSTNHPSPWGCFYYITSNSRWGGRSGVDIYRIGDFASPPPTPLNQPTNQPTNQPIITIITIISIITIVTSACFWAASSSQAFALPLPSSKPIIIFFILFSNRF